MKKIIANNKILLMLVVVLFSFGCKKTLDINVSPNNPRLDKATPQVLFPSGVLSTAGRVGGDMAILGGLWSQYWTQSASSAQYKTIDSYNLSKNDFNGAYNELFSGALNDYQLTIKQAQLAQNWQYNLMGTVMKAYTYQVLVDLYDKVPYSEAFQGSANIQPKFDDGFSVYIGLLAEIDAALAKDYKSKSADGPDFIFGGDMNKWEKFANTLKLKMYLRMINAKPVEAAAGINKLYADKVPFLDVNAGVSSFTDIPNGSNPFYEYNFRKLNTTTNLRASRTLASFLMANSDPRIVNYFGLANPASINQGDFTATAAQQPTYASAATVVQKATDPVWFISAAESNFMQAEALERFFAGAGAKQKYDQGVTDAFSQYSLAAPTTLLAGTYAYPVAGTFQTKLESIITQKWVSLFGSHALEAFFEQQRTGFPRISAVYSTNAAYVPGQLVYSNNGVTGVGNFPKRLVFPDSERSRNKNTPAEVPITTKVWWAL